MRLHLFYIFFFFTVHCFSQEFQVVVSNNKVGLNETFEISFILNNSGKNFTPPPFSDFQILRGPNKSSSTSIINGDLTQEITYRYVLKPKKIGVFTIHPATIKSKGKTIGSKPVTIQVQKGSVSNKKNTPYNQVSRKVHLGLTSNKQSCYVGEPIVLTYVLYFNLNVGNVSQKAINYGDFLVNNINVDSSTRKRRYKGEDYNSAIIKQVVLVPRKAGIQSINQLHIDLVASVPSGRRDFFMTMSEQVDYTATSNSLSIKVLELPESGRPNDFSGAIGNFVMDVDLSKDSIDINESALFTVKISGSGNLTLINTPSIDFESQIEVFDPKNLDKININYKGIEGYKKDEYLIVPRYKGTYRLKPISFSFFNPKTKKYVSLKSKEKIIKVGGDHQPDQSYTLESVNKEAIDLINEDIKFIKVNYDSVFLKNNFSRSIVFYILFCFGLFIFIFSVVYKKKNMDFNFFFKKNILKQTLDKINKLKVVLNKKEYDRFQSELLSILFFYVSMNFGIQKSSLSIDQINHILVKNNIDESVILDYLELIKYLEKCKYSPHQGDKVNQDLYLRSLDVINKIEASL